MPRPRNQRAIVVEVFGAARRGPPARGSSRLGLAAGRLPIAIALPRPGR